MMYMKRLNEGDDYCTAVLRPSHIVSDVAEDDCRKHRTAIIDANDALFKKYIQSVEKLKALGVCKRLQKS